VAALSLRAILASEWRVNRGSGGNMLTDG
jgi:hypothetical protein